MGIGGLVVYEYVTFCSDPVSPPAVGWLLDDIFARTDLIGPRRRRLSREFAVLLLPYGKLEQNSLSTLFVLCFPGVTDGLSDPLPYSTIPADQDSNDFLACLLN